MEWYPFKFEPILKKIIWGGSKICSFKHLEIKESGIGESWELSQVPGSVSVVANGPLKGMSLTELMERAPEDLLGKKIYKRFGMEFPLLVKFIDAEDDLSIQVHPNDALARKRHDSFGKTEMWYVVDSKPGSKLISGFSKQIDADEYSRRIADNSIEEVLQKHEAKSGDVFFLPAGRVHAIGSGLFIAEIQQSSNITYRLYDYNRKDALGNGRELHTELAKEAIDFEHYDNLQTNYQALENELTPLVSCPYFTTNRIHLKADESGYETIRTEKGTKRVPMIETLEMDRSYEGLDSFVIYVCMKGEGQIQFDENEYLTVCQGETVLLPASIKATVLSTTKELLLLESYIL
ncbi:MAG TPA: type I phosphomannose isomerase catalytic subunit [Bacteroidales bacterium]|nr:type I phosphomannose isomerase catalytic subunit [Bacteroidales bacterium]